MGKNYNINRTPITDEEIESYKDFDQVLKKAGNEPGEKPPKNKNRLKRFLSLLAVAGAAIVLFFTQQNEEQPTNKEKQAEADSLHQVNSLIADRYDESEIFYISSQADTFTSSYGTQLIIPEHLLNVPHGDSIAIRYSEFHDWAAISMAGIPMTYDSADVNYAFETGGMIDIRPLKGSYSFNPGKKINIRMVSLTDDPSFNHYKFNEEIQNWEYKGKEEIEPLEKLVTPSHQVQHPDLKKLYAQKKECEKRIIDLQKQSPNAPQKANPNNYSFNLEVDAVEFPELASFKNMTFEVLPGQEFDAAIYDVSWDDIQLNKDNHESYTITLIKGNTSRTFNVEPALSGESFDEAFALYQQEKNKKDQQIKLQEKKKEKIEQEIEEMETQFEEQYMQEPEVSSDSSYDWTTAKSPFIKSIDFARYKKIKNNKKGINAFRVFNVTEFGLYNCDKARKYPNNDVSPIVFRNEDGKPLEVGTFYLADRKKNTAYTFNHELSKNIAFNPRRDNIAWGNTKNGEIFVSSVSNWKEVKENKTIPVKIYKNCNTTLLRDVLTYNEEE